MNELPCPYFYVLCNSFVNMNIIYARKIFQKFIVSPMGKYRKKSNSLTTLLISFRGYLFLCCFDFSMLPFFLIYVFPGIIEYSLKFYK